MGPFTSALSEETPKPHRATINFESLSLVQDPLQNNSRSEQEVNTLFDTSIHRIKRRGRCTE